METDNRYSMAAQTLNNLLNVNLTCDKHMVCKYKCTIKKETKKYLQPKAVKQKIILVLEN